MLLLAALFADDRRVPYHAIVPAAPYMVLTPLLTLATPASFDEGWIASQGLNRTEDYGSRDLLSKVFEKYGYLDVFTEGNKVTIYMIPINSSVQASQKGRTACTVMMIMHTLTRCSLSH